MNATLERPRIILHACGHCRGDLVFDEDEREYRCLQCARPMAQRPAQEPVLDAELQDTRTPVKRAA